MALSKLKASQLANPSGWIGWLAGFIWNRRNAALNDTALECLALQADDCVLEIGFGGGYLLKRMSSMITGGMLAGVDISPAMLAYAQKYNRKAVAAGKLVLKCASAGSLPFPDGHFTKACSVNSIFYWNNPEQGLTEVKRVLAAGGGFVLCFTARESIEQKDFARSIHVYSADEVERLLALAGFREITSISKTDKYRQYFCMTGIN